MNKGERVYVNPHKQLTLNHPRAGCPQWDANMAVMGFALSGKPCDKAESPQESRVSVVFYEVQSGVPAL